MLNDDIFENYNIIKEYIKDKKIIIFGYGLGGSIIEEIIKKENNNDYIIVDKLKADGIKILSPDILSSLDNEKHCILVASSFVDNIYNIVKKHGYIENKNFFHLIDYKYSLVDELHDGEELHVYSERIKKNPLLIAITRVRNESLILNDFLNHLSKFCDMIIAYDDCSTDETFNILKAHKNVAIIVRNNIYENNNPQERMDSETFHRGKIYKIALKYSPSWILCADADERYVGDIRGFIKSSEANNIDAIRISLYDSYITRTDKKNITENTELLNFRKFFGPERRDILMLWKNTFNVRFMGKMCREPVLPQSKNVVIKFNCQHFGKSISENRWEEKAKYYSDFFPEYREMWQSRMGKCIHDNTSDFGNKLYDWNDELFENSIIIHPVN